MCLAVASLLVVMLATTDSKAAQEDKDEPNTLHEGYSASIFVDVDRNDAQAVTDLWCNIISRKKGLVAKTKIYDKLSDLEKDLKLKKVDLVAMVSNEFVELKNRLLMDPLFISSRQGELYESLVLLVRRDSGIRSIVDLRNKIFIQSRGRYAAVHRIWLETLLMKEGVPNLKCFFASYKEAMKPSQAVMPVFFRQADACITTRNFFEVLSELNPQLRRDIMVLKESRPIATGVIAIRKDLSIQKRDALLEFLENLHQDPLGKQLLTMFRMDRLVPYKHEYLATMEAFLKEHHDLRSQMAKGVK